ncbi:MAG: hypothetical protein HYY17_13570 [Planctomycetes bacterium]|nr:hypothetical protein [Planctomycetota bacterium]
MAFLAALLFIQESDRTHFDQSSGEVTLAADPSRLAEHSRPTKWHVVTDMVVFRGRLLASACYDFDSEWFLKPWAYSNGAQILEYSPESDEWKLLHEMAESMVLNVRVVDDRVLIPEFFPLNGRSRLVHAFDGKEWGTLGLLPAQNWHVMDVLRFGGALYVSGSWRDESPGDDPRWWKGYGRVFRSADDGRTWTEIHRTKENGRVLDMVEFRGRLYANEIGKQFIAWDGKKWEEIPVRLEPKPPVEPKLGSAHLMVFADRIVAINSALYYLFDGKKWTSHTPGYVDLWREGKTLYGLRDDGHVCATRDAVAWERVTKEGVPAKEFARMAEKGRPLHRGAVAVHRGRLFVGTGAEGRIYAAPYHGKGRFVSKPQEIDLSKGGRLTWDAVVPKGTSLKVRVRSAESMEALDRAAWADAPAKGHRWVQWRADLASDGKRTPVARNVRIAGP